MGDGADDVVVRAIAGPTEIEASRGDNAVGVGSAANIRRAAPDGQRTLEAVIDVLTIHGGDVTGLQLDASGIDVTRHGLFVLNTGSGDDTVHGAASTLGFVVFGGPGNNVRCT